MTQYVDEGSLQSVRAHGTGSVASRPWLSAWHFLRDRYFTLDLRSLGLFRVAFGTLLLCDLLYRARNLSVWYSNEGLMPNHVVLWAKPSGPLFSFFFTLSSPQEARWGFIACGFVFLAYTLGLYTRLSQLLSCICIVSLNSRLHMLENGGDIVVNILATLTLFLPLGSRFSLDALLRHDAGEQQSDESHSFVSLACFALLLQLALIYLFNVLHKTGASWREGSAVHYTLHQDRLVTALGVWLRENLSPELLQWLTWGTLLMETSAVVLIVSPLFTPACRTLAVVLVPLLHLGFALCLDLGPFPYVMMCFFLLLLPGSTWERAACTRVGARVLALAQSAATRLYTVLLRLCEPVAELAPVPPARSRFATLPRELAAALVLGAILFAVSEQNAAVPEKLRLGYPALARSIVDSGRLFQGWRMFAPEAPFEDFALTVDAVTVDGRHVDPYNEIASPNYPHVLQNIPPRLGQDQYFTSYSLFFPNGNFSGYRHILENWILRYPERTGNPRDRIASFKVYQLIDRSPPPGQLQPTELRKNELMHYP